MMSFQFKFLFHSVYMSWILLLLFHQFGISEQKDFTLDYKHQDNFLRTLADYEVTIPSAVTEGGDHVTYKLHPVHSMRKRSVDTSHFQDNYLHYKIRVENKDLVLQVKPNYGILAPGAVIERRKNNFNNISDSTFRRVNDTHRQCHYHGEILNVPDSRVALAVCTGLMGFIHTSDVEYFIEPLKGHNPEEEGQHKHVIYRRSALPANLDPDAIREKRSASSNDGSCGVKREKRAERNRERWQFHHRQRREGQDHHRRKRSVSTERYVETLVVVDPKMVEYHESEHLETYILTIMNMVATMFHDATVGNSINIVLVRILMMEEHQEELVITHHADNTLTSFCKFQKTINFKDDDHPNHHDVAILLTRQNICSRMNEPCSTLGLAQVAGMCQPHRSCNINEDTGLALAYTITHELGHNFGMHHDGYKNGCKDPPGKQLYIMSPSLVADSLTKRWSNCSKASITTFIDRDWGYCLDDEPADHEYNFPVLPSGTMYDADHQCRLQYGTDQTSVCSNREDVCSNLWCRSENRCSTHLEAAAEGTICGTNKWCYQGECVKIGNRLEAINGEWSQWGEWTSCTRTCGAGVSHSQRHCDNPRPSDGGKYCLGERKRFRICNTDKCPDGSKSFHAAQCEEFNYIPYKKSLYVWEHVPMPETPCQLHCRPKDQFFSVLLKDIVTDGTRCTPGRRDTCISGRCRHVGCDHVIDSKATEDRCGVCHGDGTTCTTIKSQYNESQGLGYVQATVIPKWARNISVEEVAAANNFLALQNEEGEYYLNGHWFIQWSGDYEVAGTVVHYERIGNKESFHAPGPLEEPLRIMLLLQSENPGLVFEYTVPKENISDTRIPEFHWQYQPWTHCTASCGGGTQRMEVVCVEIEAGQVDDQYCNTSSKPDDKQKVCNEHLCPARWWSGPWQHCSVTCGQNGTHQRTVICVRSLGPDEQIALDDEECQGQEKPEHLELCHKKGPCPGGSPWSSGEWSNCGRNPCALKYRTVTCEDPTIGCQDNPMPVSEMPCSNSSCGQWYPEEWQECTRTCDGGIQVRKVACEGGLACDHEREPRSNRECNTEPCPITTPTTIQLTSDDTPPPTTPTPTFTSPTQNPKLPNSSGTTSDTATNQPEVSARSQTAVPSTIASDHVISDGHVTTPLVPSMTKVKNTEESQPSVKENSESDDSSDNDESNNSNNNQTVNIEIDATFENAESTDKNTSRNETQVDDQMIKSLEESDDSDEVYDNIDISIFEGGTLNTASEANVSPTEDETEQSQQIDLTTELTTELTTGLWDHVDQSEVDKKQEANIDKSDDDESTTVENTSETSQQISEPKSTTATEQEETTTMENENHGNHHHSNKGVHKHRHNHGYPEVVEETEDLEERHKELATGSREEDTHIESEELESPDTDNDKVDTVKESELSSVDMTTLLNAEEERTTDERDNEQTVTEKMSEQPQSSTEDDFQPPPQPTQSKYLPALSNDHVLPPLSSSNNLPPLPNIHDLPPLPSSDDLPPLPNSDNLPALPNIHDLPPLPSIDNLPPLPNSDNLPALPKKHELPPLPSSDDLPPLPSIHDLPPLPSSDNLPPLPNSDNLPALPKKHELPPLPNIHDLPPLPNGHIMPPLPNRHDMPPLPKVVGQPSDKNGQPSLENLHLPSIPKDQPPVPKNSLFPPVSGNKDSELLLPGTDQGAIPDNSISLPKTDMEMPELPALPDISSALLEHPGKDMPMPEGEEAMKKEMNGPDMEIFEGGSNSDLYKWQHSEWTTCSRVCGGGVQTRSVGCVNGETDKEVHKRLCHINLRPSAIQECNNFPCLSWSVSEWSQCSATCGTSVQSRHVSCPVDMSCDPDKKPIATRSCDLPKCVSWVSGQWSQCDKTCGGGNQFRIIQCVNLKNQHSASGCPLGKRPADTRSCNKHECVEQKAAALKIECATNEMSSVVCRALRKMNQCHRRYVKLKCCKTCESHKRPHHPKTQISR